MDGRDIEEQNAYTLLINGDNSHIHGNQAGCNRVTRSSGRLFWLLFYNHLVTPLENWLALGVGLVQISFDFPGTAFATLSLMVAISFMSQWDSWQRQQRELRLFDQCGVWVSGNPAQAGDVRPWVQTQSCDLRPGDIVRIMGGESAVPADILLLNVQNDEITTERERERRAVRDGEPKHLLVDYGEDDMLPFQSVAPRSNSAGSDVNNGVGDGNVGSDSSYAALPHQRRVKSTKSELHRLFPDVAGTLTEHNAMVTVHAPLSRPGGFAHGQVPHLSEYSFSGVVQCAGRPPVPIGPNQLLLAGTHVEHPYIAVGVVLYCGKDTLAHQTLSIIGHKRHRGFHVGLGWKFWSVIAVLMVACGVTLGLARKGDTNVEYLSGASTKDRVEDVLGYMCCIVFAGPLFLPTAIRTYEWTQRRKIAEKLLVTPRPAVVGENVDMGNVGHVDTIVIGDDSVLVSDDAIVIGMSLLGHTLDTNGNHNVNHNVNTTDELRKARVDMSRAVALCVSTTANAARGGGGGGAADADRDGGDHDNPLAGLDNRHGMSDRACVRAAYDVFGLQLRHRIDRRIVFEVVGDLDKCTEKGFDGGKPLGASGVDAQATRPLAPRQQQQQQQHFQVEPLWFCEFTNTRRRQSVIVRDFATGEINVYCKGLDSVMFPRCTEYSERNADVINQTMLDLEAWSRHGYATLVVARRVLSVEEWNRINEQLQTAAVMLDDRHNALEEVFESVETSMEVLGAIATTLPLHEGVRDTISALVNRSEDLPGMSICHLSGKRSDACVNVAQQCGLIDIIDDRQRLYAIDVHDDGGDRDMTDGLHCRLMQIMEEQLERASSAGATSAGASSTSVHINRDGDCRTGTGRVVSPPRAVMDRPNVATALEGRMTIDPDVVDGMGVADAAAGAVVADLPGIELQMPVNTVTNGVEQDSVQSVDTRGHCRSDRGRGRGGFCIAITGQVYAYLQDSAVYAQPHPQHARGECLQLLFKLVTDVDCGAVLGTHFTPVQKADFIQHMQQYRNSNARASRTGPGMCCMAIGGHSCDKMMLNEADVPVTIRRKPDAVSQFRPQTDLGSDSTSVYVILSSMAQLPALLSIARADHHARARLRYFCIAVSTAFAVSVVWFVMFAGLGSVPLWLACKDIGWLAWFFVLVFPQFVATCTTILQPIYVAKCPKHTSEGAPVAATATAAATRFDEERALVTATATTTTCLCVPDSHLSGCSRTTRYRNSVLAAVCEGIYTSGVCIVFATLACKTPTSNGTTILDGMTNIAAVAMVGLCTTWNLIINTSATFHVLSHLRSVTWRTALSDRREVVTTTTTTATTTTTTATTTTTTATTAAAPTNTSFSVERENIGTHIAKANIAKTSLFLGVVATVVALIPILALPTNAANLQIFLYLLAVVVATVWIPPVVKSLI